ncbi:MAG: DUF2784 domain-containing protein [Leptospiraceae bacterium]|nr:DUF2784 domain-containing protein [Leptospiraceae bacterium]MDW7975532.1 DUF2784 family protein [Leptospiraceae bacterium]
MESKSLLVWFVLDFVLEVFHLSLVLFNLFGWIFPRLRLAHFVSLNLVFLSWVGLGYFYGWGYCPITDYHWYVKAQKGEVNLPYSYIDYTLQRFGLFFPPEKIDFYVLWITIGLYLISLFFFIKRIRKNSKNF